MPDWLSDVIERLVRGARGTATPSKEYREILLFQMGRFLRVDDARPSATTKGLSGSPYISGGSLQFPHPWLHTDGSARKILRSLG
jgi:hypothetical protein